MATQTRPFAPFTGAPVTDAPVAGALAPPRCVCCNNVHRDGSWRVELLSPYAMYSDTICEHCVPTLVTRTGTAPVG